MHEFDKRLASILVKRGVASQEEMDQALQRAASGRKALSEVLTADGIADENVIIGCVSAESHIPPIDLSRVRFNKEATDTLDQEAATSYGVLPISRIGNILTVAVANPFEILKLDDVQLLTHCEIRPVLSTELSIKKSLLRAYSGGEEEMTKLFGETTEDVDHVEASEGNGMDIEDLMAEAASNPIIKLVNMLILRGIQRRAADVHVEPFERITRVRYRIDGVLQEDMCPPKRMHNAIVSRIKVMSSLDIAERKLPQDGKFQLRVQGRQVDFRVSILPVVHGEKAVLRILDKSNLALNLEELGWEEKSLELFRQAIRSPWGMVMCVGPTGCGKTTTLYSALREIASLEDNLITVEDPVEYQLEGINQVQVNPKRGRTFAGILRSILRQDPDIVMVGEIRDLETAEIAIQAALTGHLVLSTLHTNDAPNTITRMVDMGIDPFMVAASVVLVLAQRLCRRLCDSCKEPVELPAKSLLEAGFRPEECESAKLYQAKGCGACANGYSGRFAIVEPLPLSEGIKKLVLDGASAMDLKGLAVEEGMISLRRAGILNAIRGKTSVEEVMRVTLED